MPLLRYSLYSQNVNLWLAPTADARDTWHPLMRTVAAEGRCFVLSAISCVRRRNLPSWITGNQLATSPSDQIVNGSLSPQRGRRRSTFTANEGKHQLALPAMDEDLESSSLVEEASVPPQPSTINGSHGASGDEFVCRGGSCICGPLGQSLAGPLWDVEDGGLLIQECDFDDCERGRLDLDVAGSYSRNDAFHLTVDGLDLNPPP